MCAGVRCGRAQVFLQPGSEFGGCTRGAFGVLQEGWEEGVGVGRRQAGGSEAGVAEAGASQGGFSPGGGAARCHSLAPLRSSELPYSPLNARR